MCSRAIALILFILLGNCCNTIAQPEKGDWHFGIGGGANLFRYTQRSVSYSFIGSNSVEAKQENWVGFQGGLSFSYQAHRILQIHGAFDLAKVKTYTTIKNVSSFPFLGTLTSNEIIDQEYLMLEIPVHLRLHLRQKSPPKYGVHIILDVGGVVYTPISNKSYYQRWEDGLITDSREMDMSGIALYSGFGLGIGDANSLMFNWSPYKNALAKETNIRKITFTHFFDIKNNPSTQ